MRRYALSLALQGKVLYSLYSLVHFAAGHASGFLLHSVLSCEQGEQERKMVADRDREQAKD